MCIITTEYEAIIARDIKGIFEGFGHSVLGVVDTVEDVLAMVAVVRPNIVLLHIRLRGSASGIVAGQTLHDTFHLRANRAAVL